jgi:hypothetical protein
MHMLNQRRQPRQPIRSFLCVDFKDSHEAPVLDLSESGVSVVSAVPLISNKRVTCRLDLDRPIEAEGVITRADDNGRAGIQFVSMSEPDRQQLKEWLFINALTGGVPALQDASPADEESPLGNLSPERIEKKIDEAPKPQPPAVIALVEPAQSPVESAVESAVESVEEVTTGDTPAAAAPTPKEQDKPPIGFAVAAAAAAPSGSTQAELFASPKLEVIPKAALPVAPIPETPTAEPPLMQLASDAAPEAAAAEDVDPIAELRTEFTAQYLLEELQARPTPARRQAVFALSGVLLFLIAGGFAAWILRSPAPVVPAQQASEGTAAATSTDISKPIERTEARQPDQSARIAGGTVVAPSATAAAGTLPLVTGIRHWSTPQYTRVEIRLQQEVGYLGMRLHDPERIVVDLHDARLAKELVGKEIAAKDGRLLKIRVGQYRPQQARVVLDVGDISDYSASLQSNPARLVIDVHGGSRSADVHRGTHPKYRAQKGKSHRHASVVARTSSTR